MKTKIILLISLVALFGGGVLWLAPHRSWAADTMSAGSRILGYTCPMHPSVKADKPVHCSICGMTLQPVYERTKGTNAPAAVANTNKPPVMMPGCCSPGGCR